MAAVPSPAPFEEKREFQFPNPSPLFALDGPPALPPPPLRSVLGVSDALFTYLNEPPRKKLAAVKSISEWRKERIVADYALENNVARLTMSSHKEEQDVFVVQVRTFGTADKKQFCIVDDIVPFVGSATLDMGELNMTELILYPGKVMAVYGGATTAVRPELNCNILATRVLEMKCLPPYCKVPRPIREPPAAPVITRIQIAFGPYGRDIAETWTSIQLIHSLAKQRRATVLVLGGPFIMPESSLNAIYSDVRNELFQKLNERLTGDVAVVALPSASDDTAHWVFPSRRMVIPDCESIQLCPNPCVLKVGSDFTVGISTADVFADMTNYMIGASLSKFHTVCKEICKCRSFYPLYPTGNPEGTPVDYSMSQYFTFGQYQPDIIALPQSTENAVPRSCNVEGTVFVAPRVMLPKSGAVARRGHVAEVTVYPPPEGAPDTEMSHRAAVRFFA